ncbi:radical SAM/SPASM domain-containing protein [Novosphingobium sp. TH158]|uniref:radical SAM/SPASM domain-containing protein n=1 Tax=Novosphingobium sp. TH158 TaxID=2067455 RepID=UPI0013045B3E|nr:radical SAM/SPASM domain-containing protein [Novosphingobium sp. TH158]
MPIPLFKRLLVELQSNCNRNCFFCNREFDTSGKRYDADRRKVIRRMPTEQAISILNQAQAMGFSGNVAFHHYSEPFLDDRIIDMAHAARERGMVPYEHTNGDVLRQDKALSRAAAEVFDHIVVGLYDYKSEDELREEMAFWEDRLAGTRLRFSLGGDVFPRVMTPHDTRMFREKQTYPGAPCLRPLMRLIVHYDGMVPLCCEDMETRFDLGNAFSTGIADLWFSDRHVEIVKALKKGERHRFALCAQCPIPPVSSPTLLSRLRGRVKAALPAFVVRH